MIISNNDYQELRLLAKQTGIKISKLKIYNGKKETLVELFSDIELVAKDFPLLTHNRKKEIHLCMETNMGEDFGTTYGHLIKLNNYYYSNIEVLKKEYQEAVDIGRFVKDTDYHSVIFHELGHAVSNIYQLKPLNIAKEILGTKSKSDVFEYVRKELSSYSANIRSNDFFSRNKDDGEEIIAECFSAYYGKGNNTFANQFVHKCIECINLGGEL